MPLKREELREFAVVGARARLVDLEKERQRLFAEFPELERSYAAASEPAEKPTKRAPKKNKPKDGRRSPKKLDTTAVPKLLGWLQDYEKPVKVIDVAKHFGIPANLATYRIQALKGKGLLKSTLEKVDGRTIAHYELTPKGEKMDVPVNGVS